MLQDQASHDAFDTALKFEENDVDNVALLTVSVQGKQYSITPHEVSQMPLQSFSALWTVSSLHARPDRQLFACQAVAAKAHPDCQAAQFSYCMACIFIIRHW